MSWFRPLLRDATTAVHDTAAIIYRGTRHQRLDFLKTTAYYSAHAINLVCAAHLFGEYVCAPVHVCLRLELFSTYPEYTLH
jgi:hypothetical protein